MLRRLRWMAIGAGLGATGSWWTRRQARRAAASLAPALVGRRVVSGASRRVAAARHDARLARRATEDRLRGALETRAAPPEAAVDGRITSGRVNG